MNSVIVTSLLVPSNITYKSKNGTMQNRIPWTKLSSWKERSTLLKQNMIVIYLPIWDCFFDIYDFSLNFFSGILLSGLSHGICQKSVWKSVPIIARQDIYLYIWIKKKCGKLENSNARSVGFRLLRSKNFLV